MPKLPFIVLIVLLVFTFSCSGKKVTSEDDSQKKEIPEKRDARMFAGGMATFSQYCTPCHSKPHTQSCNDFMNSNIDKFPGDPEVFFKNWVMNSDSMVAAGDEFAIAVSASRPDHHNHLYKDSITNKEMDALFYYIRESDDFYPKK